MFFKELCTKRASLVTQLVKTPHVIWETWVRSLGWEDPLKKRKANPFQYSGLENSMDCIVHGVAKSRTETECASYFDILASGGWS